ncbi:MAG: helix-turn-helix transcriptional regulator [Planctomycetes bacterium]|nr:helix-turn-helix transcriptional regulator [Planctomycetota bacterium]
MGRIRVQEHELLGLASFLAAVYRARTLPEITELVVSHVRDALPPAAREPVYFTSLRERLDSTLHEVSHSHPPVSDANAEYLRASTGWSSQAHEHLRDVLLQCALHVQDNDGTPWLVAVLRTVPEAMAEAAACIAERASDALAIELARDLENLGAPPAMLFGAGGNMLWLNSALRQLLLRRRQAPERVRQHGLLMATPLLLALRQGKAHNEADAAALGASRRIEEIGLLLRARPVTRGSVPLGFVQVEVSEAKRAVELSPRELQVALALAQQGRYRDVAERVGVKLDSVRTYIRRVYRKLGVNSHSQLLARMVRDGMMPAPGDSNRSN